MPRDAASGNTEDFADVPGVPAARDPLQASNLALAEIRTAAVDRRPQLLVRMDRPLQQLCRGVRRKGERRHSVAGIVDRHREAACDAELLRFIEELLLVAGGT